MMDNRDFKNRYGNTPEHNKNNGYFILGGLLLIALTVGVLLFANDRPDPSEIEPAAGGYSATDTMTDDMTDPDALDRDTTGYGTEGGMDQSP